MSERSPSAAKARAALCVCGHPAYWHSEHDRGRCLRGCPCECRAFVAADRLPDPGAACMKCGTPGARYSSHVCMTAGEVPDPPATRWLNPSLFCARHGFHGGAFCATCKAESNG